MAAGAGHPQIVGQKVREIVESGTWQLRHPVGPDAESFLAWRRSINDEKWVQWSAQDDVWRSLSRTPTIQSAVCVTFRFSPSIEPNKAASNSRASLSNAPQR